LGPPPGHGLPGSWCGERSPGHQAEGPPHLARSRRPGDGGRASWPLAGCSVTAANSRHSRVNTRAAHGWTSPGGGRLGQPPAPGWKHRHPGSSCSQERKPRADDRWARSSDSIQRDRPRRSEPSRCVPRATRGPGVALRRLPCKQPWASAKTSPALTGWWAISTQGGPHRWLDCRPATELLRAFWFLIGSASLLSRGRVTTFSEPVPRADLNVRARS